MAGRPVYLFPSEVRKFLANPDAISATLEANKYGGERSTDRVGEWERAVPYVPAADAPIRAVVPGGTADLTADLLAALERCEVVMTTAVVHGVRELLPPAYRDSWVAAHTAAREAIRKAKGEEG